MEESSGSFLQRIIRLVPLLMIGLLIMGMVMFAVTSVVPRWREYQSINSDLEVAKQTIAGLSAGSADDVVTILQHRIDTSRDGLTEAASVFMTAEQADTILDNLYAYAQHSGVQITNLQAQQSSSPTTSTSGKSQEPGVDLGAVVASTFKVQAFRLRVDGGVPGLMAFVARIREASVPGVIITNLDMRGGAEQDTLMLDVLIYSSPFSTGETYLNLPEVTLPPQLSLPVTPVVSDGASGTPGAPMSATPVTLPPMPPEPPTTLLLGDTFDSGDLTHWNLGAGWYLAPDEGGQVLEVKDSSSDLTLAYNTLKDTAVQTRVWLDTGGIRISLRQSSAGRYSVTLDSLGLIALYRGETLLQTSFSSTSGVSRWRTLRISAIQGVLRVSVDGIDVLRIADDTELPPGTVTLAMTGKGIVRVDDIEVWVLEP
jgi:hypothetical protein